MSRLENGYSLDEQVKFSILSGDYNPIHTDIDYSKRSLWGGVVVHGIHQVLSVLDLFSCIEKIRFSLLNIHVEFVTPLGVGVETKVIFKSNKKNIVVDVLSPNGLVYTNIIFSYKEVSSKDKFEKNIKDSTHKKSLPKKNTIDNISKSEKCIDVILNYKLLQELFPNLVNVIPYTQIAIILTTTQIVGMNYPGENSIFSKLDILYKDYKYNKIEKIKYKVNKVHNFFKLVDIIGQGDGFEFFIRSFVRPELQNQSSVKDLIGLVNSDQFLGSKVLVIGGSKGIGEVASKLLSIGGAEVTITYFSGESDAKKIVRDLNFFGYNSECMQLNVFDDNASFSKRFTHLYYFASPRIFSGSKDVFSEELFENFSTYYLEKFVQIVQKLHSNGLKKVFYPSTTAIDEMINGMWEYSSVKFAGEHLCDLLEKRYKDLKIYKPRFPRISTDQTLTVMPIKSLSPEDVLVDFMIKFHDI